MDTNKKISRRKVLKYGLYGGLAGLSSSLWVSGCGKQQHYKRPNIIFILIDALRADRLGSYGHQGGYTPILDTIATESVVFERAIAPAPWTQPSIASLFCSRYPGAHKVVNFEQAAELMVPGAEKVVVFNNSFVTLAEVLQKADYATAAFVANPFIMREFGFGQGFEHFDASFAKNETPGKVVNKAMLSWLRQEKAKKPFFCFLHYMDVHGPYNARPEFLDPLLDKVEAIPNKRKLATWEMRALEYLFQPPSVCTDKSRHVRLQVYQEYWAARYDGAVREIDYHIGQLKTQLEKMGLWEDSYVIVTADHGESLLEHECWDHGFSVYHPELHVPLLLRQPGGQAAKRIHRTVRLIDLMPTLIDQLNLPEVEGLQGMSLAKEIMGKNSHKTVTAFAEGIKKGVEKKAIYLGDWKLIITPTTNWHELYNISDDPLEQNDLSVKYKSKVKHLAKLLQKQVATNEQLGIGVSTKTRTLTPEQLKRLRSLGYVE